MTTTVGVDVGLDWNDDWTLNEGWITREDASLKAALQGITVRTANQRPDPNDDEGDRQQPTPSRPTMTVPVFFRLPEKEERRKTYPYITIDFLTAVRDPEREHRGQVSFDGNGYTPAGTPVDGDLAVTEFPIPMTINYQITAFSRFALHDRAITQQLQLGPLEPRFGALVMVDSDQAPTNNGIARLDILSGPTSADVNDESGKRIFRKVWTVAVSSEYLPSDLTVVQKVRQVVLLPATQLGYQSV